jgi:hypothetical protein
VAAGGEDGAGAGAGDDCAGAGEDCAGAGDDWAGAGVWLVVLGAGLDGGAEDDEPEDEPDEDEPDEDEPLRGGELGAFRPSCAALARVGILAAFELEVAGEPALAVLGERVEASVRPGATAPTAAAAIPVSPAAPATERVRTRAIRTSAVSRARRAAARSSECPCEAEDDMATGWSPWVSLM